MQEVVDVLTGSSAVSPLVLAHAYDLMRSALSAASWGPGGRAAVAPLLQPLPLFGGSQVRCLVWCFEGVDGLCLAHAHMDRIGAVRAWRWTAAAPAQTSKRALCRESFMFVGAACHTRAPAQVEYFRLILAEGLMPSSWSGPDSAAWRLALAYLAQCPVQGRAAAETLLDALPVSACGHLHPPRARTPGRALFMAGWTPRGGGGASQRLATARQRPLCGGTRCSSAPCAHPASWFVLL